MLPPSAGLFGIVGLPGDINCCAELSSKPPLCVVIFALPLTVVCPATLLKYFSSFLVLPGVISIGLPGVITPTVLSVFAP